MAKTGRERLGAVAVILVAGLSLVSCGAAAERALDETLEGSPGTPSGPSSAKGAPTPPGADAAGRQLGRLEVAPASSMAGYDREEFPHWAADAEAYGWREPDGSCDVRDAALARDGRGVRVDEDCSMVSGRWLDPYTGATLRDSGDVDIDHFVPLANAWRSGAADWGARDREAYANDPGVLLSADDGANQAKGDKSPEAWRPPNRAYWCEYSRRWIGIKRDWDLSVTGAEKTAIRDMLSTCKTG